MKKIDNDVESAIGRATELVAQGASEIFRRFGMRPVLGRIWALLYLSKHPMDADVIREQLAISSGALNTGLRELVELGLLQRETVSGEKKFYYRAQKEMWLLFTRIYKERERDRVLDTLGKIREAETVLLNLGEVSDGGDVAHRLDHIQQLMKLGDFVVDVLDALMARTRVEIKAAQKWLSVSGRLGGEPLSRLRKRINAAQNDRKR